LANYVQTLKIEYKYVSNNTSLCATHAQTVTKQLQLTNITAKGNLTLRNS